MDHRRQAGILRSRQLHFSRLHSARGLQRSAGTAHRSIILLLPRRRSELRQGAHLLSDRTHPGGDRNMGRTIPEQTRHGTRQRHIRIRGQFGRAQRRQPHALQQIALQPTDTDSQERPQLRGGSRHQPQDTDKGSVPYDLSLRKIRILQSAIQGRRHKDHDGPPA